MKLLTLNSHSLIEDEYEKKLDMFVDAVIREQPDIIALQEVNQSKNADIVPVTELDGMTVIQRSVPVRADNHAANAAKLLGINGIHYNWVWLPIKTGYGKYDEGAALLSRFPIEDTDNFLSSASDDYDNWKTRRILGIKTKDEWFYSVHMGWWKDEEEPFSEQWKRINAHLSDIGPVWLMGDFNCRADMKNEGYDLICASGWHDTYTMALQKDSGVTVEKAIDGWKEWESAKMRIDYIWKNSEAAIKRSKVVFNGKYYGAVSDHYGVMVDTEQ